MKKITFIPTKNSLKNKDILKAWWRKRENLEDYEQLHGTDGIEVDDTLKVVMGLPDKYKTVVYLYYYEGYTSVEIADIHGESSGESMG